MPRRYPVEFRRKVLDLIETGIQVAAATEMMVIGAEFDLRTT